MTVFRGLRIAASLLCLASTGCTTLRELPRNQIAARPERQHVRIKTLDGLEYEFDFVRVASDTLVGYRQRDVEGRFTEYATLEFPLDRLDRVSVRAIEWKRTGWIVGGILAGVVTAGIATKNDGNDTPGTSGGGRPYNP